MSIHNYGLNPYLKFVTPALLAVFATVLTAIEQGSINLTALEVGFYGLLAATISFVVTNGPTGFRKYAKALAPAALAVVSVVLHYVFSGELNESETRAAVVMGLSALVTLWVPNNRVSNVVR